MSRPDMREVLTAAIATATEAGKLIAGLHARSAFEVRRKSGVELVTTADIASDELLRGALAPVVAGARFLSEEVAVSPGFDFTGPVWVIDPLDGTANYAHGHPFVAVSVALVEDGEPALGVVHAPFLGETFSAMRGGPAILNGQPIRASETRELRRALVGTGFPHDRSDLSVPMERVRRLLSECQDVRRSGAPSLDICWVAAGRLDAHCESLAPWDIAAARLIASEAGALCGSLVKGNEALPPPLRGEEFLAAAPGIFMELSRLLCRET